MPRLRIDPWDPEYGGSIELEELPPPSVDLDVEDGPWEPRRAEAPAELPCCAFVDGVRRIDVRLFAEEEEGGVAAPALAGSWAVGVAWAVRPPRIGTIRVGRGLVVGGGLEHAVLDAPVGDSRLAYPCVSVPGSNPVDPIQGLQNLMREDEGELARGVFEEGEADLLVLDGPLTYFAANGPVVGLIKRQSRSYLPPDRAAILSRLDAGCRTPLFRIGHARLDRYSWYVRLAAGRPIDGVMTGVVRLEVSAEVGTEGARRLADLTAGLLPRFASVIGRDPRAPQNLYPVGQLETVLRHRLGDPLLLKRGLEAAIWRSTTTSPSSSPAPA